MSKNNVTNNYIDHPAKMIVADAEGNVGSVSLDKIVDVAASALWYGVRIDESVESPDLERIGNMEMHRTLPIQSGMRRCLAADDGSVIEYLDPDNSALTVSGESAVLDGSAGQVMVEIPEYWFKVVQVDENVWEYRMSPINLDGYLKSPRQLVSMNEANAEDEGNNTTGKLTSIATDACAVSNISSANYLAKAKNRGAGWVNNFYLTHKTLFWLYTVEYATFNSQKAYNAALDANGFRQGGLGAGVSSISDADWNTFNGRKPFIPTNFMLSCGNHTAVKAWSGTKNGVTLSTTVNQYRGVAVPFGHVYKWTSGLMVKYLGDGSMDVYACENPNIVSYPSSLPAAGWRQVGTLSYSGSEDKRHSIGKIFGGEHADLFAKATGGSSSTRLCDQVHLMADSNTGVRVLGVGGDTPSGSRCGFACALVRAGSAIAHASYASRLCWVKAA